jgi:toxin CptA
MDTSALAGRVQVSLDLQQCVLLRWSAGRTPHWLWLERRQRPERWDDLRRAVYSRARMEAPREDEPSAATS